MTKQIHDQGLNPVEQGYSDFLMGWDVSLS